VTSNAWRALQGTLAATVAWAIARRIGNHDPFFAPIAAFIALNAPLGERGLNAVRLTAGVFIGIIVGEAAVLAFGNDYAQLAVATFVASGAALALRGSRITVAQAVTAAILVVSVSGGEAGLYRLVDAGLGAAVALVFSQVLFAPEPLALIRRAETSALDGITDGLELTARAMESGEAELGERALERLRDMRDRLAELARVRRAGARVARRSAIWRSQHGLVVQETENAGHLDLLAGSCVMFVRSVLVLGAQGRAAMVAAARGFAEAAANLADDLADREARQRAADRALDVARQLGGAEVGADAALLAAISAARMVATDVMTFAGVDADEARDAVREGTGVFEVSPPPSSPPPLWRPRRRQ
jgi:Fusaric acid resistance protein-like